MARAFSTSADQDRLQLVAQMRDKLKVRCLVPVVYLRFYQCLASIEFMRVLSTCRYLRRHSGIV